MAVWTPVETKLLINLVRQNYALYDQSSNDYRNRDVLKTLWNNIADEMNRSGRIFLTDMDCRDRWNTLRDGYRRFLREDQIPQSGTKPKKRKIWHWSEDMSFLKPYIQERTPSSPATSGESTCNRNQRSKNSTNKVVLRNAADNNSGGNNAGKDIVAAALSDTLSNDTSTSYIVHIVADNTDTNRVTNICASNEVIPVDCAQSKNNLQEQNSNSNPMEMPLETSSSSVEPSGKNETNISPVIIAHHPAASSHEDSDEQFFRSLLPDVKSLGPRQKGLFKIKVQQLLQEMLYPKESNIVDTLQQPPTSEQRHPSQVTYGTFENMYQSERWTSLPNSNEYIKTHHRPSS